MNHDEDPRYGVCDGCGSVGYELQRCADCGADLCNFCDHQCPEE